VLPKVVAPRLTTPTSGQTFRPSMFFTGASLKNLQKMPPCTLSSLSPDPRCHYRCCALWGILRFMFLGRGEGRPSVRVWTCFRSARMSLCSHKRRINGEDIHHARAHAHTSMYVLFSYSLFLSLMYMLVYVSFHRENNKNNT